MANEENIEINCSRERIYNLINDINEEAKNCNEKNTANEEVMNTVATRLYERCRKRTKKTSETELQEMIAVELMKERAYGTAKKYVLEQLQSGHKHFTPILYSTGCPNCREVEEALNSHGVEYIINNDVEEMIKLGFDEVPVFEVLKGVYLNFTGIFNLIKLGGEDK